MWSTAARSSSSALAALLALAACAPHERPRASPRDGAAANVRGLEEPARPVVGILPSSDAGVTAALVAGARRAFDEARAGGGPDLAIVVGASASGWSSIAAEAVRLACEERAVALIAPPERELAHPVSQAATRCGVTVVSTSPARSVAAAGSRFVVSVAAPDGAGSGYDAGRAIVEAVRRGGLSRAAVAAAAPDATAVTLASAR